eukprot:768764-Hanusia_phi.AAC.2
MQIPERDIDSFVSHDPLLSLNDTIYVHVKDQLHLIPFKSIGLIFRTLLILLATHRMNGGQFHFTVWDYHTLKACVFLCCCDFDFDDLPIKQPRFETVEIANLFQNVVHEVLYLAELLDVSHLFPEPSKLFSARWCWMWRCWWRRQMRRKRRRICKKAGRGLDRNATTNDIFEAGRQEESIQDSLSRVSIEKDQENVSTSLPILQFKDTILSEINNHTVTCIQGETGCGKSSMVPQFILEDGRERRQRVNVIVSQPRRLAAVSLARRVASQNNEEMGRTIGYRIGQGDHVVSKDTMITFVTIGYLLQYFSHHPENFSKYTHVVLDEVHERGMDSDLLNLLIKKLMQNSKSSTKLVIMSATLQAHLFGQYFTPEDEMVRDTIFVGARRYPVEVYFLDEWKNFSSSFKSDASLNRLCKQFEMSCQGSDENSKNKMRPEITTDSQKLIIKLLTEIVKPKICILIFLPGIGEIASLQEELEKFASFLCPLQILVLHSLVSREEQEAAMHPAMTGHCKLILSTNIAESSITIPDVLYVIDSGLHRLIWIGVNL